MSAARNHTPAVQTEAPADDTAQPTSSAPRRYILAAILALAGLIDATYLTIEHLTGRSVRCTVSGGCNEVLQSAYAKIGAVPTAALGALAYFTVFSLATLIVFGYTRARTPLNVLVALMLAASLGLLFVQAFVLHAFCEFCLLSAAITILLSLVVFTARPKHS